MKSYRACTRYSSGIISLSLMSCERDTEAVWWYSTSSFNELNFTTQRKNLPAKKKKKKTFSNFSCRFLNPQKNFHFELQLFYFLRSKNLQEQVKKAFCQQKLFWPFDAWTYCSSDLKNFANSWPSASNFKSFSRFLEHFFSHSRSNNFCKKIPISIKINLTNTV